MMTPDTLLHRLLSITEGTPFPATITASSDECEASARGTVVFTLRDGRLRFVFYVEPAPDRHPHYEVLALGGGSLTLEVPSQYFRRQAVITSIPNGGGGDPYQRLLGDIEPDHLGDPRAGVSSAVLYLLNLPEGHWGVGNAYQTSEVNRGGKVVSSRTVALDSQMLCGDGWTINLHEIPGEHRDPDVATHACSIWREDGSTFTGEELEEMLDGDLQPFLSLMFGQHVQFTMLEGRSSSPDVPSTPWGRLFPYSPERRALPVGNWFTIPTYPRDVPSLFNAFCGLTGDVKRHFRRVIRKYVTSETIAHMGRAEMLEEAAGISFAGLDGLTRSIISTYSCRNEWLQKDLRLRRGRGIGAAIEMAIERELGGLVDQDALVTALAGVRNATLHTDLGPRDSDVTETLFRWEQCQFLIEALILARLGLTKIPNRTSRGKFQVMGRDMFSSVRQYEIRSESDPEKE